MTSLKLSSLEEEQNHFVDHRYLIKGSIYKTMQKVETNKTTVVFAGDSITEFGNWEEFFREVVTYNRGICGDTVKGLTKRLDDIKTLEPNKMFVLIGVNDFSVRFNADEVIANYQVLLQKLKDDFTHTTIYIRSILPVIGGSFEFIKDNVGICKVNQYLESVAPKFDFTFINLYEHFLDKTKNEMKQEYTADGVHVNAKGYALWCDLIKPYILN